MPTPVSTAKKCLTEEAARVLDDAVAVARRRCHPQTTSLHAVSALLALSSSSLREVCLRARTCAYSPRLHFRALELSVGVSLDRLPSSKTALDPPVSNSLMAAIKRSQANQRRQPESFHFHRLQNEQQTTLLLKVELKHLIFSILDDPIVSRVLGEAGYRSYDIKLAIMHPPITQSSRFSRARCPPIFLCNLIDSDFGSPNFCYPFSRSFPDGDGDVDGNCRRIGQIMVRKSRRNPLLIGACSTVALQSFIDCVQKGKLGGFPTQISGLSIISIGKEISDFLNGGSEEILGLKFKEVGLQVEKFSGPGVAVNYGELTNLLGDDSPDSTVSFVVSKLTDLMKHHSAKLWLIGAAGAYEAYVKFLSRFPAIERDWDLHLLPITSSKSSFNGSKSSLMGSFVPFGGFFSTPSDFSSPLSSPTQPATRCHPCSEKYEQELAGTREGEATACSSDWPFVVTDLGLGTMYPAANPKSMDLQLNNEENMGGFSSSDLRDFKSLNKMLTQKVGWQHEAILDISKAISLCRSGRRRRRCSTVRGDIWLTFLGHDKVGKKKIAEALADVLFRSTESLICFDLGCEDRIHPSSSLCESRGFDGYNPKFRGTLMVDVIAEELRKKPRSIVYLENIDKADPLLQNSLSRAIKTGKFPDSRGREISFDDTIFVVTLTVSRSDRFFRAETRALEFPEERILAGRNLQMQLFCSYSTDLGSTKVRILPLNETSDRPGTRKRKHIDYDEPKRSPISYLDLNLPVEDLGEETSDGELESDSASDESETWLEDFLDQVDEKIAFKPHDFDANAKRIMKAIELQVERVFAGEAKLEIDYQVMVQILAADWLGEKETTEAWIDQVLQRSLVEAKQNYNLPAHTVLKLSNSESVVEEQAPGACLPARINVI